MVENRLDMDDGPLEKYDDLPTDSLAKETRCYFYSVSVHLQNKIITHQKFHFNLSNCLLVKLIMCETPDFKSTAILLTKAFFDICRVAMIFLDATQRIPQRRSSFLSMYSSMLANLRSSTIP